MVKLPFVLRLFDCRSLLSFGARRFIFSVQFCPVPAIWPCRQSTNPPRDSIFSLCFVGWLCWDCSVTYHLHRNSKTRRQLFGWSIIIAFCLLIYIRFSSGFAYDIICLMQKEKIAKTEEATTRRVFLLLKDGDSQ